MNWFILEGDSTNEAFCQIWKFPTALPKFHRPSRGIAMGSEYPAGLRFQMAPEVKGNLIADVVPNALGYFMVSKRMKELLSQHATADIEYLPFSLLNTKGRVVADDLHIVNVLGTRDWADIDRSFGARRTSLEGEREFERIRRLYLRDDAVDPSTNLFRLGAMPKLILMREDLREHFERAGMTGAVFHGLGVKVDIQ
ncbi:imm11 family protein [Myxococcus qinghaiensis]|uniref:imm11 family protein n=1 Tax=Myxococcus qinghaiensis TaxID=2906758 RepID=UPI0020A78E9C|nr:DUF1629 domain-containing protein [Myxococcus qinghaiensis]MCP3163682.1 hypothetical protein [Myxococcus qinghaiensis]